MDARRSYLSALRRQPIYDNYLAFKKQEVISKRVLKAEKCRGWRSFCSSLNANTPISFLWRFVKRFRSRHFKSLKTLSFSNLHPTESVLNTINSLCPPSVIHRAYSSIENFPNNYSCKIFDSPILICELTSVIRSLKTHSAPGLDRIDNRVLFLLPKKYLPLLLDILNNLFDSKYFPVSWQHYLVFLIPKSTLGKYLEKLRPSSLTSSEVP